MQISLVTVGDPGNLPDPATAYGAVPYVYQIGEYDVTVAQYTQFLNSVATSGNPYGLYNASMGTAVHTSGIIQTSTSAGYSYSVKDNNGSMPVFDVSWGDAARFVNWLQNGEQIGPEGPGTTETGTYLMSGATSNAQLMAVPARSSTATWVLPTVNEYYKAAYYSGGGTASSYWVYSTPNGNNYVCPYNNPWNNQGIAFDIAILQFFAAHDIAPST